jgi:hypothetical protein
MKRLKQLMWWGLVVAVLLPAGPLLAGDIDLTALIHETQKMSQKPDEMDLVWWIPEEFWIASFAQNKEMTAKQVDEFLKVVRPYTMVAVVNGSIGAFGAVTYKPEEWVRANTRLIDAQGKTYAPRTDEEIDASTKNMLQMIKPVLANILGPMGKNFHFLLFPAKTAAGGGIAPAKEKGQFTVRLGEKNFKWRLPLDSVLPAKVCTGCGQEGKGSWSFCPWCGKKLSTKE